MTADTALAFGDLRGLGLIEMVHALTAGRAPRASGHLAAHVLEVLLALERSADDGTRVGVASRVERPSLPD